MDLNIKSCEPSQVCEVESQNIVERLASRKKRLEFELGQVNEALKDLEENPQIAKVLVSVSKIIGRY